MHDTLVWFGANVLINEQDIELTTFQSSVYSIAETEKKCKIYNGKIINNILSEKYF